jgi:hypothetical protein
VEELGIGEFARRSRLPAKALRIYDDLGLCRPGESMTGPAIATTKSPSLRRPS